MGPSGAHLELILGPSWGHLGPSWGHLRPSWGHLGPCVRVRRSFDAKNSADTCPCGPRRSETLIFTFSPSALMSHIISRLIAISGSSWAVSWCCIDFLRFRLFGKDSYHVTYNNHFHAILDCLVAGTLFGTMLMFLGPFSNHSQNILKSPYSPPR